MRKPWRYRCSEPTCRKLSEFPPDDPKAGNLCPACDTGRLMLVARVTSRMRAEAETAPGDAMSEQQALPLGDLLRDGGIKAVIRGDEENWHQKAARHIVELASDRSRFTAEDVRALAGDPPHPNLMGAAFRKASQAGLIVFVGYRKAARPSRHSNRVGLWQGSEKA